MVGYNFQVRFTVLRDTISFRVCYGNESEFTGSKHTSQRVNFTEVEYITRMDTKHITIIRNLTTLSFYLPICKLIRKVGKYISPYANELTTQSKQAQAYRRFLNSIVNFQPKQVTLTLKISSLRKK